jgi:hypothetical protein
VHSFTPPLRNNQVGRPLERKAPLRGETGQGAWKVG